jgi:hypothetical protein
MDKANWPNPEEDTPHPAAPALCQDAKPHRGPFLLVLGYTALLVGASGLLVLLPLVVALSLSIVVWLEARHDLAEMRSGRLDRGGERETRTGLACARCALGLSLTGLMLWALVLVALGWGSR